MCRDTISGCSLEVVGFAQGFILDGLGVALARSTDECARICSDQIRRFAGEQEATRWAPACPRPWPGRAGHGVAGHAMDYDDTRLSTSEERFIACCRPTTPVLAAVLAIGEKQQ